MAQKLADRVNAWLQQEWYGKSKPNPLLLPFEAVFKRAVAGRLKQYRNGSRSVTRLPVPVIVVGNITVGGTGKTPLTIWLANFLVNNGYRPGIVSRGYGGTVKTEPAAVHADSDAKLMGDEPVLIARRTGCPVFVFPGRVEAAKSLLAATECNVIIADDGLQHYALGRDIEIAVIDGIRQFGNGHCLPAGPLREPSERLESVDFKVYTGGKDSHEFAMQLIGDEAINLLDETFRKPLADFAVQPFHAVAAIGNPERFFEHLRGKGLVFESHGFADHYVYTPDDLNFPGSRTVLMTEKDAVKCRRFATADFWYVPVRAELSTAFAEQIGLLLKEKCNG